MSTKNPQLPQGNWVQTKLYAKVTLIAIVVAALAQALLVFPAWNIWPFTPSTPGSVLKNTPTPAASPSASPSASSLAMHEKVCGVWLAEPSQKKYDFVCLGKGSFEVYEVSGQGLNKTGAGKITEDGNVEADIRSSKKNRTARLKLKLSTDGRKMEGSWRGDDPRESGLLTLSKI